jgi:predicted nucleic acid-binding protein
MTYCLDTSAWLEYFNAGPHGPHMKSLLQGDEEVITPAVVAAQLIEAARLRDVNSKEFLNFLESRSRVAPISGEIARIAGKLNAARAPGDPDWSLLESLVLATARHHHARLVTADPAFAGLPQVDILPPSIGGA